jgi:hypothetical protein
MIESPSRKQPSSNLDGKYMLFKELEREAAKLGWAELGARSAPFCVLTVNEPKKTGAHSADKSH